MFKVFAFLTKETDSECKSSSTTAKGSISRSS